MPGQDGNAPEKAALGGRIRELRLERGWTQEQLAERVGLKQKQISSYERGANVPSSHTLIRLAKAINVSLDDLAQLSPPESAQAPITDLDLLEKTQQIDRLSDQDRALVRDVMDLVVFRSRARHSPTSDGAVLAQEQKGRSSGGGTEPELELLKRVALRKGLGQPRLRDEAKIAQSDLLRDLLEILSLDSALSRDTIAGADSHHQQPVFVALLLERARREIPDNPAESLSLANAALISCEKTHSKEPDPQVRVAALAVRGNAKRALGRLLEAETDLEEAWRLLTSSRLRDPAVSAEVYRYLGSLRKDQGRLDEAASHLQRAGILYDVLDQPEKAARVLMQLSAVYYRSEAYEAAVEAAREALEILPPDAESWLRAYGHYNLAHRLFVRGNLDRAEAELEANSELLGVGGGQLAQMVVWLRARIAWSRDDVKLAERLYTEALRQARQRGIAFDTSQVSLELALVYLAQGRTARVKKLAIEALEVFAEQEVEREIRAALDLIKAAALRDAITRELLERAITALERARHSPRAKEA